MKESIVKEEYYITGMSCTNCASNIEKIVAGLASVSNARVDFSSKKLMVSYNHNIIKSETIFSAVKEKGFELSNINDFEDKEIVHLEKEKKRLILAWVITLPLSVKMLLHMIWGIHFFSVSTSLAIDLILSFFVIFIVGFPVIKVTLKSIISFEFNMDSLIGIGSIAAFMSGILILFGIKIESFVSIGAMIISINFIGNYLKLMATGKAGMAIKELLELGAKNASLINDDGIISIVSVEDLKAGNIVFVKPGEKIPTDGVIVDGFSSIDQSIVTGESMPVDKTLGDKVVGGTINQEGSIKVKVESVGKDTFLARVVSLVQEAQGSKVPIQAVADKVTRIFVPIILIISLLTFIFWIFYPGIGYDHLSKALYSAIASLVIACPCALGLATPTALMVGMGKGAKAGIIIRNGEAIQMAKSLDVVVFDKTGTITNGSPVLDEVITNMDYNEFLSIAAGVEQFSEHPFAKAVTKKALELGLKPIESNNFLAITGRGLSAQIDNKKIIIGSIPYFDVLELDYSEFKTGIDKAYNHGKTVAGVSINDSIVGVLIISDSIKFESREVILKLQKLGLETVMLTGDSFEAGTFIAKEVGIDSVKAELMPHQKINIIKEFQSMGKKVAMVGDGINDAPALKQADVGIALGTGTDIAIESGDITLVTGNLSGVVKSIKLSKATFSKIQQNLFWAFFYNIIAIPLAVSGVLHPAVSEVAMALSSINVVLNSLRLRRINL